MRIVGTGTRILNFLVDTLFIFLLAFAAYKTQRWYVYYYGIASWKFGWFFFTVLFMYYFLLENFWGRTLGKLCSFSKVVNANGSKPSVLKVFIRSIIRITIIDMFFIPFVDKPLHDYLSGTDVVEI